MAPGHKQRSVLRTGGRKELKIINVKQLIQRVEITDQQLDISFFPSEQEFFTSGVWWVREYSWHVNCIFIFTYFQIIGQVLELLLILTFNGFKKKHIYFSHVQF